MKYDTLKVKDHYRITRLSNSTSQDQFLVNVKDHYRITRLSNYEMVDPEDRRLKTITE